MDDCLCWKAAAVAILMLDAARRWEVGALRNAAENSLKVVNRTIGRGMGFFLSKTRRLARPAKCYNP